MTRACLVDVYDTIVNSRFESRQRDVAAFAGVDADLWLAGWLTTRTERDLGTLSVADSVAQALLACGIDPAPELVDTIVCKDAELLRQQVRVFDDSVPFLDRRAGERHGDRAGQQLRGHHQGAAGLPRLDPARGRGGAVL